MTNDYRAMCAELLEALEIQLDELRFNNRLCTHARTLLAQPEPEEPTDEDLDAFIYGFFFEDDWRYCPEMERSLARAVLARWGRPAAPPAEGEVRELVAELRGTASGLESQSYPQTAALITRAAELLEQRHPAPVPVSERLPGPEDCDAEGMCWLWERDCGYNGRKWVLADRAWSLSQSDDDISVYTHWLPANALPIPEAKP